jgi:CHC2 zinc finger
MATIAGQAAWNQWIELARSADLLKVAQKYGARVKKTGTAEFAGPCPSCLGTDRFSINVKKQVFNCRRCGGAGNVIGFVEWIRGIGFVEACEEITGIPRPDRSRDETQEDRAARLRMNADRKAEIARIQAQERAAEEAQAKRDEEAFNAIIDRSVALQGTYGWDYLLGRGLRPHPQLVGDIRFVEKLDYWGAKDNGTRSIIHIATLPAIIARIRDFSGAVIGIAQTYLDPKEPRKWKPEGSPSNSNKKIRGDKKGGLIHLGFTNETMAIAEGWENALAWHQLAHGPEDVGLGAAVDLGNLSGAATGTVEHPVLKDSDGRFVRIRNGVPDMQSPGMILPDRGIKNIILLADLDSETYATAAHLRTAGNRFRAMGLNVDIAWPSAGKDWNDVLVGEMGESNSATHHAGE